METICVVESVSIGVLVLVASPLVDPLRHTARARVSRRCVACV